MTLTLLTWSWIKVVIRLRDILIKINLAVRSYIPDTVLGMCALRPWPRRYDLWSRSCHTLGAWTTIARTIIQIQLGSEELWPGHGFSVCLHCDLDLGDMTWIKVIAYPWVMDNICVKYYPDPTGQWGVMARTRILDMCTLWPWPWRYDLRSRAWHTLWSWTTIVWNIIQIGQEGKKLWPGHDVNRRTDRQTGRRTGWFLYTPQLCLRGYKYTHTKYYVPGHECDDI